ncbi:MAG TPA: hypothetical protein VHZ33_06680 [Trebonia sp.]|jgi:hypothetical protein|nr:hypothetical protein [Trebonia sp.]
MAEQQEVIAELTAAGVLAGIRWAYESATRRSLETYSEADGHDPAWLGHTRFTLFRDRLDRVFACARYAVPALDGGLDREVLQAELSERDLATLPRLAPGLVRRHDLRGSAGWAYRRHWFLIASAEFGRIDTLPWLEKSVTKQLVALQPGPDHRQPSLFEDLLTDGVIPDDLVPEGAAPSPARIDPLLLAADQRLKLPTFIVAHTLDPESGEIELTFGRPWLNLRGGPAWHWRENLLTVPLPAVRTTEIHVAAEADTLSAVPDAHVRLRVIDGGRQAGQKRDGGQA